MKDKKIGTLDDLIEAACSQNVTDEAANFLTQSVIDVTGIELTPGDPERCKGNGKHEGVECCCDACDHLAACFPEQGEGKD